MAARTPVKDVLVVGFGAVGAIYSLILKRSGLVRVTAVARSNYDAVNIHGLYIRSKKYGDLKGWRPDRLCSSVASAADKPYSYVIVTTKAVPEVTKTPVMLAPLLTAPYADNHPQPTYVLLQNGLNVERDLYEALKKVGKGEPKIISTGLYILTNLAESNVVEHGNFEERLTMGVYRHNDYTTTTNSPEEAALLSDIGGILEAGGMTINIVPEIQRMKFTKNFWNIAFSSISTLTGYPIPAIFRPPPTDSMTYAPYVSPTTADLINTHTIPTLHATLRELLNLGWAMGFPNSETGLPSSLVETVIEDAASLHRRPDNIHRPSMLLDAERGQPIEVEVIFGEVVRLAKEYKVDIPRIEMLYALLIVVQNQILRKLENR